MTFGFVVCVLYSIETRNKVLERLSPPAAEGAADGLTSDFLDHLGPVLEHRHFVADTEMDAELAVAGGLDGAETLDQLRRRAGQGDRLDRLRR